jgi:hypothetical protein
LKRLAKEIEGRSAEVKVTSTVKDEFESLAETLLVEKYGEGVTVNRVVVMGVLDSLSLMVYWLDGDGKSHAEMLVYKMVLKKMTSR